jgi:Leucine-rich repeat (LRR) protein
LGVSGLAGCSSLRELHLAGNKISEIEGLHRLLKLSFLDLSFNKLTTTKAISQLAANYHSLQALNLLGNALHSNLGDEPLRKLVTVLAPHILYLNKQAVKAVSARDAAVDSVARAAMGTANHHHTARGSKVTRGGLNVTPIAPTSQGKFRNGEKGSHPLHIVPGGHSRTSTVKETTRKQQQQQHHHSQQQHYQQHSGNKEHPLHSLGIQSSTPAMESRLVEGDVNRMVLASGKGKKHMKSGGSLFENDRNHQVYLLV